jgi:hypothetical protein
MGRAAQSTHSSDAIPTHRTLELLDFDEKSTFYCFCFIWAYKVSPALYAQIKQNNQKWIFHRKLKVPTSVISSLPYVQSLLLGDSAAAVDRDRAAVDPFTVALGNLLENNLVFFQYSVNKFERPASKLYLFENVKNIWNLIFLTKRVQEKNKFC